MLAFGFKIKDVITKTDLKSSKNTNIFKHNMKDEYFNLLTKKENDIYVYY